MNAILIRKTKLAALAAGVLASVGLNPVLSRADSAEEPAAEYVVVLHGLMRSDRNTRKLAAHLESERYDVINFGYNSRQPIDELAVLLADAVAECCSHETRRVHFATHSMGSIVVRHYLESHRPENLGRVVMLGPPNGGSELADKLPKRLMRWIAGPSALQLGTETDSVPRALGPVDYDVGVIAGGRSVKPIASRLIPGDDDGLVAIDNTRVDGMRDHIVMPVHHQELVKSTDVAAQVAFFISNGAFERADEAK